MSAVKTILKFDIRQIKTTPPRDWSRVMSTSTRPGVQFKVAQAGSGSSVTVRAIRETDIPFIYTGEIELMPQTTYETIIEISDLEGIGNLPVQSAVQEFTTSDIEEYINIMMYFQLRTTGGDLLIPPAGIVLKVFDTEANRTIGTTPLFTSEESLDNNLKAGKAFNREDYPLDGLNINHACFLQRIGKNAITPSNPYAYWLEAEVTYDGNVFKYKPSGSVNLATATFQFYQDPSTRLIPFTLFTLQQVV